MELKVGDRYMTEDFHYFIVKKVNAKTVVVKWRSLDRVIENSIVDMKLAIKVGKFIKCSPVLEMLM